METIIILAIAVVAGLLTFIALTLNSISRDLFRIRRFLDDHEHELIIWKQKKIHTNKIKTE